MHARSVGVNCTHQAKVWMIGCNHQRPEQLTCHDGEHAGMHPDGAKLAGQALERIQSASLKKGLVALSQQSLAHI